MILKIRFILSGTEWMGIRTPSLNNSNQPKLMIEKAISQL